MKKLASLAPILFALVVSTISRAESLEWIHYSGSTDIDRGLGVAADQLGNVFLTGLTLGNLAGPNQGKHDAFVSKYDSQGVAVWMKQFGTNDTDYGNAIATDGAGNAFVAGYSGGNLGGLNAGSYDAFVAKHDASGSEVWTRQLGSSEFDSYRDVTVDGSGHLYAVGFSSGALASSNAGGTDAILSKYDVDGAHLWTIQWGGPGSDDGSGVTTDAFGNTFVSVTSSSSTGPSDAFISRFNANGELVWKREVPSDACAASHVAADLFGNVYVSGQACIYGINGSVEDVDAYLSKFSAQGDWQWSRLLRSDRPDFGNAVATDRWGNVFLSGHTEGTIVGESFGHQDAFAAMYDTNGALVWIQQVGTQFSEASYGVATDGLGSVYLSGYLNNDVFLAKIRYSDAPVPGDTNGDGVVDLADLNNVRNNFGGTGLGDTNGDDLVDLVDLNNVRNHFGEAVPAADVVPEPASCVLALTCLVALIAVHGQNRARRQLQAPSSKLLTPDS